MTERRVLIPVNHQEHSERAIKWYIKNIGKPQTDHVIMLTVIQPKYKAVHVDAQASDVAKEICENMSKFQTDVTEKVKCYTDVLHQHGFMRCNHEFKSGSKPGEVIVQALTEENINICVIGNRQLGALKRTLVGSVSDYVLHHGHVPVVIVPPHGD